MIVVGIDDPTLNCSAFNSHAAAIARCPDSQSAKLFHRVIDAIRFLVHKMADIGDSGLSLGKAGNRSKRLHRIRHLLHIHGDSFEGFWPDDFDEVLPLQYLASD